MGAASVGAGPPRQLFAMPLDESYVVAECDGFQVLDHVSGELTVTGWTGKDGKLERIVTERRGRHDLRNSVKNVAVVSSFHQRFMTDVDAARTQIVGPAYHVTVPGHGSVLFETGVITFDNGEFTYAGRHDAMSGNLDRLCAAFA